MPMPKPKSRSEYINLCRREVAIFLDTMYDGDRFYTIEYARGKPDIIVRPDGSAWMSRGTPFGAFVVFSDMDGRLRFGWSSKHPTKEREFVRVIGAYKAIRRAVADDGSDMRAILDPVPEHLRLKYADFKHRMHEEYNRYLRLRPQWMEAV